MGGEAVAGDLEAEVALDAEACELAAELRSKVHVGGAPAGVGGLVGGRRQVDSGVDPAAGGEALEAEHPVAQGDHRVCLGEDLLQHRGGTWCRLLTTSPSACSSVAACCGWVRRPSKKGGVSVGSAREVARLSPASVERDGCA